jgi:hypothetical protein
MVYVGSLLLWCDNEVYSEELASLSRLLQTVTQIHPSILPVTQIYPNILPVTQNHRDILPVTQIHPDILPVTQIHPNILPRALTKCG